MPPSAREPLTSAVHGLLTFLVFCISESAVWLWSLAGDVSLWVQWSAHVIAVTFLLKTLAIGLDGTLQAFWRVRQRWRVTFGRSK